MIDTVLLKIKKYIPKKLFYTFEPAYHFILAFIGAVIYGFPSRNIHIIGVSGTKGKTTVVEFTNAILEEAGYKTAISSTMRIKIGSSSKQNPYKMTMPGRFVLQKLIRKAVSNKCDFIIIEITSEGAKQSRDKFIKLNSLIFTNLSPEHIEAHGSFEKYRAAEISIIETFEKSKKQNKVVVANKDDSVGKIFLNKNIKTKYPYGISDVSIIKTTTKGSCFNYEGEKIHIQTPGVFNIYNSLAAIKFAQHINIPLKTIRAGLEKLTLVRGRMEYIKAGQSFCVVVDYAHTPVSLENAYGVFDGVQKVCVLGGTGGGRDIWKRPAMGKIADKHCDKIILTNEDPYDEDPMQIINQVKEGIKSTECTIILNRRKAIAQALSLVDKNGVVIITGKGTDPYIMEANGTKTIWDDATVAREELEKLT